MTIASENKIEKLLKKNSHLVEEFKNNNGVIFIGAGISKGAGLPSWHELIKPLADNLGIEKLDWNNLLDVPQYYINETGGEYLLRKHIEKALKNNDHKSPLTLNQISELPTNCIITTNYDLLIEKTLDRKDINYRKVIKDEDLGLVEDGDELLLLKMNGCITEPKSIVITKQDYHNYREERPEICSKLKTLMHNKTFLFLGFSFRDPVFHLIYSETLKNLKNHRRPFYFLALNSNKYEIEEKKRQSIIVLDLQVVDENNPTEVAKFLDSFVKAVNPKNRRIVESDDQCIIGKDKRPNEDDFYKVTAAKDFLSKRLGTGLSLVPDSKEEIDTRHKYNLLLRQDLLDYNSGDFYSIRRIKGKNISDEFSSYLQYSEASEEKVTFYDTNVAAINTTTHEELLVKSVNNPDLQLYKQIFKIHFKQPLSPGDEFDITYTIRLPGELQHLDCDDEIMSISLSRIKHPIDRLDFNVVLNFEPKATDVNATDIEGNIQSLSGTKPSCKKYIPSTEIEEIFDIQEWSSEPYIIRWGCDNPDKSLYIIRYMR